METERKTPTFFDASKSYTITGEQVQIINFLTRYLGADGAKIRDILRDVVFPKEPSTEGSVQVRVMLGGKNVCGDESRPTTCLACPELANCVLALFYETLDSPNKRDQKKSGG